MTQAVESDDSRQQFWKVQRIWQRIIEDLDLQVDRACGWHTGLCRYIEKGDVETVEKIFKYDPIFANQPIYQHLRKTSLYIACKTLNGQKAVSMVKVLLKYGANPNIRTKTGITPLMKFLKKDRSNVPSVEELAVSVVADLLNAGSFVNITDKKGNTALKIALEYGRLECLNVLLQHIHKKSVGRKRCLRFFSRTGRLPKEWLIMLKAGAGDLRMLDHLLQDRKREEGLEIERMRIQIEIAKFTQPKEEGPKNDNGVRDSRPKLPKFDEHKDDTNAFLDRYERFAQSQNWYKGDKA
ncbi:uncharacterized protein LOC111089650, partial [Limulus polyphemus]|uniref:Alpha-latrotoxin n=1 Tax=Limulus polyphemus TaxID=6850 RepID=A0ABM1TQU0_LIMPO